MNSKQTEPTCNLSNAELIDRVEKWVHKLAETGGQAWTLRVPVDFNHDPDMLIIELCKRFSASLPSKPVGDVEEMDKVIKFLALELPEPVWNDVNKKWQGFKSGYAAAPQKGMNELFNKLKREFEFVGDEKISGITALRLIKSIFDESPSPSEAGDEIEIIDGYTQLAIDRRSLPKDGQHVKFMTENEEFHEGYFVGGDDIFHVTDSKFFFKWHVQQWKVI